MKISREQFECWLIVMDDTLENFIRSLPTDVAQRLDFSVMSLNVLEAWILARYSDLSKTRPSEESLVVDSLARYVGETFRTLLGGIWTIELEDPINAYYGIPQLAGLGGKKAVVCPAALVTAATDRRKGNFLSTVLQHFLNKYGIADKA